MQYDGTRFQKIAGSDYAKSGANSDITSLTAGAVTVAVDDKVLIQDTSASDLLKSVTTQSIADLPIISPTKAIGYGAGAGGAITQIASKATLVTLSTPTGRITTHNAALAAGASVNFQVFNTMVLESDIVVANSIDDFGQNYTTQVLSVWNGYFFIRLTNISAGSLSQAVRINFAVIKGSSA